MTLAVLGASGGVGSAVVDRALARGDEVRALVRDATRMERQRERLHVITGDVTADTVDYDRLVAGAEAVINCMGVARRTARSQPSVALPALIAAMERAGIERYAGIAGGGVTLPGEVKPLRGRILSALIRLMARAVLEDKEAELAALQASTLQWVLARPPRLTDEPPAGYHTSLEGLQSTKLSRADLAAFLLSEVSAPTFLRQAPYIYG